MSNFREQIRKKAKRRSSSINAPSRISYKSPSPSPKKKIVRRPKKKKSKDAAKDLAYMLNLLQQEKGNVFQEYKGKFAHEVKELPPEEEEEFELHKSIPQISPISSKKSSKKSSIKKLSKSEQNISPMSQIDIKKLSSEELKSYESPKFMEELSEEELEQFLKSSSKRKSGSPRKSKSVFIEELPEEELEQFLESPVKSKFIEELSEEELEQFLKSSSKRKTGSEQKSSSIHTLYSISPLHSLQKSGKKYKCCVLDFSQY